MKKLIFILVLLVGFTGFSQNEELFDKANAAYAAENYERAIDLYDQILENGETSVALHYNLGNAHYKLNHIAPSIYHFEKALQMEPGDEDVKNNLEFARNMAIDALDDPSEVGFGGIFNQSTSALSPSEWGWAAIFCMMLFVVFFLVYYFSRRTIIKRILFISGMFFLVLAITSGVIGALKLNLQDESSFAIIFSEEVMVKSEPNVRSAEVLTLHEGAKVKVTEDFQGWYEIELPNGTQGWVNSKELKLL
ncbi:tetratricopeptide repeat protein [Salinimicrobium soli]|uniref:tetratricopeptide repeat protein n=1 Tax=Salinimicrobium soli TaxID=1254399 RepID=UPI003AAA4FEB